MDPSTDPESLRLLADSRAHDHDRLPSGAKLDAALTDLGWLDMLDEMPDAAIPLVFRLLGETGAHAPVLNDVVLRAAGGAPASTLPLPFAGGSWVVWERSDGSSSAIDGELPIHRCAARGSIAAGRAGAGTAGAGLVAGRHQPGHAVAGAPACRGPRSIRPAHQLVPGDPAPAGRDTRRHRGRRGDAARAAQPDDADGLASLLAKAAAGQAALTAARHCQQVLGGIGFTAEHQLHHHVKRSLILDGLLGSARELTRRSRSGVADQGICAAAGTAVTQIGPHDWHGAPSPVHVDSSGHQEVRTQ